MGCDAVIIKKRANIGALVGRLSRISACVAGGRAMLVLLLMSGLVAGLGFHTALGIGNAGRLVAESFDHALVSAEYVRRVAADFTEMEKALARRRLSRTTENAEVTSALAATLGSDLTIARERSLSMPAQDSANQVGAAVAAWVAALSGSIGRRDEMGSWVEMDRLSSQVAGRIDLLVKSFEEEGLAHRQSALEAIDVAARSAVAAASAALFLTVAIAGLLMRRFVSDAAQARTEVMAGSESAGPTGRFLAGPSRG